MLEIPDNVDWTAVYLGEPFAEIFNRSPFIVLGLKPHKNKKLNFLFLVARYFVWICRMNTCNTYGIWW